MNKIFLLLAALAAASASAAKSSKPDWVDGASGKYPRGRYLVGVGFADDRRTAVERARAEVSKILSVQVVSDSRVQETATSRGDGKKVENSFSKSVSDSVHSVADKVLEGLEVPEYWEDGSARVHYALAVLDRAKASAALQEKIGEFDGQAKGLQDAIGRSSGKLARVKAAMKLATVLKARGSLNAELRVVDPDGKSLPGALDEGAARTQASKLLSEINVAVSISDPVSGKGGMGPVASGVVKGLIKFGLQAGAAGAKADISVEGEVETSPMDVGPDRRWKWARSNAAVSLKDGSTDKVFAQFDVSEKQSSADYKEAARRSLAKLSDKAAQRIKDEISAYFENQ